jgi:hypothetical protein
VSCHPWTKQWLGVFFWFSPNSFHPIRKYQLCSLFYRWVSWIPQSTLTYLGTKPPAAWQPGSELRFVWRQCMSFPDLLLSLYFLVAIHQNQNLIRWKSVPSPW